MNKDVIYIEPEDDITDIIGKIKIAKQKVIALVPPKKAGVLRSAINVKLIAKAAIAAEKVTVIITADDSLARLALATGIPVSKTLKSRPVLPGSEAAKELLDKSATTSAPAPVEALESDDIDVAAEAVAASLESPEQPVASAAKSSKNKKLKFLDFGPYRKYVIAGAALLVLLIGIAVWATVFAPAVKIAVAVRTTASNFSQPVTFTEKLAEASAEQGIFMLEEHKITKDAEIAFKATGQKNVGDKAKGSLKVAAIFTSSMLNSKTPVKIPAGTKFTYNKADYLSTKAASILPSTSDIASGCENGASLLNPFCQKSVTVEVTAAEAGEKYNLSAQTSGWTSSLTGVIIKSSSSISGGTDKIATVVQKSDIDKAKELLSGVSENVGKTELMSKIPTGNLVIDGTFKQSEGQPESTPKVDEEVPEGTEPKLVAKTTFSILTVDVERVKEFIAASTKDKIAEDQKIYTFDKPFIESFMEDTTKKYKAVAKVKASLQIGPKITDQDILEKSRGRRIGEVRTLLRSINGVSAVEIDASYPWVSSIPQDSNKITIDLKVEK